MYTPMTTTHKSRVLDMTQGDPFRLVLQFSMPLFCSNLLQQFYNLTDTALAGHCWARRHWRRSARPPHCTVLS